MQYALGAIVALLLVTACSATPSDVRFANVDGNRVAYRVLGSGGPVLVMISGLGEGMDSFSNVAPDLAAHATVILYDRAGYGQSDPAQTLRDAAGTDRELMAVLDAAGVHGPYFVLGHSLGGLFAEYFAAHHRDQVAGLILEESRPAGFSERCLALRLSPCGPPAMLVRFMRPGGRAEVAGLVQTEAQVAGITPGPQPTLVLSRSAPVRPNSIDGLWAQFQADLAARYPSARRLVAPQGGHVIHREARDWFIAQVHDFLSASTPAIQN